MRRTTTRNTPTRIAKNGPARGKYCIWPMVILKLQGGWEKSPAQPNNEDLPGRFRLCPGTAGVPLLLKERAGRSRSQKSAPGVGNRSFDAAFAQLWRITAVRH